MDEYFIKNVIDTIGENARNTNDNFAAVVKELNSLDKTCKRLKKRAKSTLLLTVILGVELYFQHERIKKAEKVIADIYEEKTKESE